MGLDMYLEAEHNFYHFTEEEETRNKLESIYPCPFKREGIAFRSVSYEVAYWRKANCIHRFFVENCQEGQDNCARYYVDREVLEDLVNRCKEVIDDKSKAEELLPTQGGYFFGSTAYDSDYIKDLENTIKMLEPLLIDTDKSWFFYYQSSW